MRSLRAGILAAALALFTLALGIILGSGPLRTALTGQTAAQADALRGQIADRDAQLLAKDAEIERGEELLAQLVPVAVRDRLAGQAVVVVIGPGVDSDAATSVVDALEAAGAAVTASANLSDTWLAGEQVAFRKALAEQIVADVGVPDATASADQILAGALVQALVPEAAAAPGPTPDPEDEPLDAAIAAQRSTVLSDVLTRAGLVTIARNVPEPSAQDDVALALGPTATLAIVLVGDQADAVERAAGADRYVRLGAAFAAAGLGTVLVTGAPQADDAGALVIADRELAAGASVVANGWTSWGPLIVVLAAQEQAAGGAGVYGSAERGSIVPTP